MMTPKEILEGNRLIADYMGVEWRNKFITIPTNYSETDGFQSEKQIPHDETLCYHSNYCSLMPVVDRMINDDYNFAIDAYSTGTYSKTRKNHSVLGQVFLSKFPDASNTKVTCNIINGMKIIDSIFEAIVLILKYTQK